MTCKIDHGINEIAEGIDDLHFDLGLCLISQELDSNGKTLTIFDLPETRYYWLIYQNELITAKLKYDMAAKQHKCNQNITRLNTDQ